MKNTKWTLRHGTMTVTSVNNTLTERRKERLKYGVEVMIIQYAYVEVEADCPTEAEHIAERMAHNGDLDFHESETQEVKVVCHIYE